MHLNHKEQNKKGRQLDIAKWFREINGVLGMVKIKRLKTNMCMHP
jgi:hypothetical protein